MYSSSAAENDAFLPVPPIRKNRLLWPFCALLLSAFVLLAMPGARIQLGASQLKGLVGSYIGHGNWRITATASGTASWQTSPVGNAHYGSLMHAVNNQSMMDLSTLTPVTTETGGATFNLSGGVQEAMQTGASGASMTLSSGNLHYQFQWLPAQNNIVYDPSPSKIVIFYRRRAQVRDTVQVDKAGIQVRVSSQAMIGTQQAQCQDSLSGPGNTGSSPPVNMDSSMIREELSGSGGVGVKDFPITFTETVNCDNGTQTSFASIGFVSFNVGVDLCIGGFNMGRFGGSTTPLSGGNTQGSNDPTFTRWLPLAFSPQMSSYPFRYYQAGALPAPWGNINCMYSLSVHQEPLTPNLDENGSVLDLLPSLGSDGTYNNPSPPYIPQKNSDFIPKYSITDVNGDRVVFSASNGPYSDVHSTLGGNPVTGNWKLTNAGPPGSIRQKGTYTYTFYQTSPPYTPLVTRLLSIQDALGNTQTLNWLAGGGMTVTDSSSQRRLVFNGTSGGYLTSVDAPEIGSGIHTHTTLTYDATGHCTAVNVYGGNSSILLHTDTFTYGGANGDSVLTAKQGVSTTSFNYVTDFYGQDPFSLAIPRLSSTTYGLASDSSSSDDGGSVAGTVSYSFGPTQQGYNNWGISAHTNSITDARGTTWTTVFGLSGAVYGDVTSLLQYGPDYAGAPAGKNITQTLYNPSVGHPQQITTMDPITTGTTGATPWYAYFDLLQNLTQITDPLGNPWKFTYTDDGIHLASLTDPTNIWVNFAYGERSNPATALTTLSSAAAGTTQFDYNTYGQPTAITVPAGTSASGLVEKTQFGYDATTGDLLNVTGPTNDLLGITGYDALGDPLGVAVYPDTGNPATSTQPMRSSIAWNAAQQPTLATMANGVQSANTWNNGVLTQLQCLAPLAAGSGLLTQLNFSYDTRGRLYQMSDPLGTLGQYKYDKNSNLTKLIDGRGNVKKLNYGSNNELTGTQWPSGAITSISYDAGGRVRQTMDERFIVCNYVYNGASGLTDIQWPNYPAENVHYTYDNAGRLLTVTDSSGSRTYQYDIPTGRLITVTTVYNALPVNSNTVTLNYGYYNDGKLAWRSGLGGTTLYNYDAAGQLTQLSDNYGNVTTWTYDHIGRPTKQTTTGVGAARLSTTYTWGVSGMAGDPSTAPAYLRQISQTLNSQPYCTYTLTHNYLGLLLGVTGSGAQSSQAAYGYDARGRMSSQQTQYVVNGTTLQSNGTYTYDASGNLNGGGNGWQYNSSNQLTTAPATGDLPGATGLTYDTAGHLTGLNGKVFTYDCWGNLTQVTNTPAGTVTYAYDSSGRRIRKTVSGVTTYFVYDGDDVLAEVDSTGAITRTYMWGALGLISDHTSAGGSHISRTSDDLLPNRFESLPGRHGARDRLALCQAGGSDRYYLYDAQGNTSTLVDGGGNASGQGEYTPYGGTVGTELNTPYAWQGQYGNYHEREPGLYIMQTPSAPPYVPAAPTYTSPQSFSSPNPYQPMNANPASYGPQDDDDPFPVDENGRARAYQPMRRGLHQLAGGMKNALNFAAGFNPIYQLGEIAIGQNAAGEKVSKEDRILGAAMMAAGPIAHSAGPLIGGALKPRFAHNFKPGELLKHFTKHGPEFGPLSKKGYLYAARSFLNTAADGATILAKTRANGDRLLFNKATNEFGVVTSNGYIRTYFIPDPAKHGYATNLDYFLAQ